MLQRPLLLKNEQNLGIYCRRPIIDHVLGMRTGLERDG
jgi:hypothetical protein